MNRIDKAIAEAGEAVERVMPRVTEFGTTEFPCGCVMGYHKIVEVVQWKPCAKHGAVDMCIAKLRELYDYFEDIRAVCALRGHDAGQRDAMRKMAEITEILDKAGAL